MFTNPGVLTATGPVYSGTVLVVSIFFITTINIPSELYQHHTSNRESSVNVEIGRLSPTHVSSVSLPSPQLIVDRVSERAGKTVPRSSGCMTLKTLQDHVCTLTLGTLQCHSTVSYSCIAYSVL